MGCQKNTRIGCWFQGSRRDLVYCPNLCSHLFRHLRYPWRYHLGQIPRRPSSSNHFGRK
jgi:hypothetical protein